MRKIFTLCMAVMVTLHVFGNPPAPTLPSSNFVFSSIEGSKISVRFTAGNGNSRIVVMKAGGPVLGLPVNGAEYVYNQNFGTTAAAFTQPGEFVVWKGTATSFTVSNLQPFTVYHFAIFEFNGTGVTTEYLMVPFSGQQSTAVKPTQQASAPSLSNITGNSIKVNWSSGNGERRLIIARKGAPVNVTPADLTEYATNIEFGSGQLINGDNYAIYKGNSNSVTVSNLEPNAVYHFAIFEANGSSSPVYLTPGAVISGTTLAGPSTPTFSLTFDTQEGNRFNVRCSRGNGGKRLFIVRKGGPVTAVPSNGTVYTASTVFGSGTEIVPGEFVINSSSDASLTLTNLEPYTTYHFRSYEYDQDNNGNTYYLLANPATGSYSTATKPNPPTGVNFTNVTGNALTIRYTAGNGGNRVVIAKEGSPVDFTPSDLVRYPYNGAFGAAAAQQGNGNYVLNAGANGTSTAVTNLRPGVTYHFAVYEISGYNYPVYCTTPATISITMPAEPTASSTNFRKVTTEGNSLWVAWNNGDGTRRIVIARKGSAVDVTPQDGVSYTADQDFGEGSAVAPGQFVMFDNTSSSFEARKLDGASTYHFAVFEYNLSGTSPDYLTSTHLAGSAATYAAPTQQVSNLAVSQILSTSARIAHTGGNGTGRIFILRQGEPVSFLPVDFTSYSYSAAFGNVQLAPGTSAIHKSSDGQPFNVSNLQPGTDYYLSAFELNGSGAPVYLKPAATTMFTTAGATGVVKPTVPASAPLFSAIEGNRVTFSWTSGNGAGRLIVARAGQAVNFTPADGTVYAPDAAFGNSADLGNGQFAVFANNTTSFTITNLQPATVYHFAVFEYNGTGANIKYLTSTSLVASSSSAAPPATGASQPVVTNTVNSMTLSWQPGSGGNRIVVVKDGGAVLSTPADLTVFPASNVFGNGSQIAGGEYVVYSNSGNTVTVTGLQTNHTYHYSIFEFNGSAAPVYNKTSVLSGNVNIASPLPVTWAYVRAEVDNGGVILKWGTASEQDNRYFVVERSTGNQSFQPIDTIPGAENSSSPRHYSVTDQPEAGVVRYRVRQVDIDGRSSYSNIIQVKIEANDNMVLYPNPALSTVKIKMNPGQKGIISIFDIKGVRVKQQSVQQGSLIDVQQLKPGIYHVVVETTSGRTSRKLIKQ